MIEDESEDDILDRIEAALRKIAARANAPRAQAVREIDRTALVKALDMLIARLRAGLETSRTIDQFGDE